MEQMHRKTDNSYGRRDVGTTYLDGQFKGENVGMAQVNGRSREKPNVTHVNGHTNGEATLNRADETNDLISSVQELVIPFIREADQASAAKVTGQLLPGASRSALVDVMSPSLLIEKLKFSLPNGEGLGKGGLLETMQRILDCSVNTWDQGFLDKLTSSTNAVGVVSELLLAVLNTNVHVYHVSPALTQIEKATARALAAKFGLEGPYAGGITCPGGSASNLTALVIARGALYPDINTTGNSHRSFAIFTSEHGHYSIQKAAVICGLGMNSVVPVPSDCWGCMDPIALRDSILRAKEQGKTPLFVTATAGTTVYGAYDRLPAIGNICRDFGLWFHVDGSFGGSAIWSTAHKHKLDGSQLANSITVNPHKMLNVPMTCSFLLSKDTRIFHQANTLRADYLFHGHNDQPDEVWDMADLTLQCGRRADSLKLALSWVHYGAAGFERWVDHAFAMAAYMTTLLAAQPSFRLVSPNPPPCLQVCFYYVPAGEKCTLAARNNTVTVAIVKKLLTRGFMVDYATGDCGFMFRVVFGTQTLPTTVEGLIKALLEAGREVVAE